MSDQQESRVLGTIAFGLALMSLVIVPLLFGLAGIVVGIVGVAIDRPNGLAIASIFASVVCMILGMAMGAAFMG